MERDAVLTVRDLEEAEEDAEDDKEVGSSWRNVVADFSLCDIVVVK
jgi:hypothetical protein